MCCIDYVVRHISTSCSAMLNYFVINVYGFGPQSRPTYFLVFYLKFVNSDRKIMGL